MSWGEALRLTQVLAQDVSSAVGAALTGWDYPATREALVLMDLYDAFAQVNFQKPKPYPRPWPERSTKRAKPDASLTQEEIVAALRKAGHTAAIPTR